MKKTKCDMCKIVIGQFCMKGNICKDCYSRVEEAKKIRLERLARSFNVKVEYMQDLIDYIKDY